MHLKKSNSSGLTRRQMLKRCAGLASVMILPGSVFGKDGALAANERLN